jgi:hypothetical protein
MSITPDLLDQGILYVGPDHELRLEQAHQIFDIKVWSHHRICCESIKVWKIEGLSGLSP